MKIATLDIGGTAIKSGMVTDGVLAGFAEMPTNASMGGEAVLRQALALLHTMGSFDRIGISTAGEVDAEKGSIRLADNIPGYTGMNLKDIFTKEFDVPCVIENDVNAAAMGERVLGAGRAYENFLCVSYGTGIGGAIILDGTLYRGSCFSAGEFGGLITHSNDVVLGEVGSGSYERYASTSALVRRAVSYDAALQSGREIFAALHVPAVQQIVDEWIHEIAFGLISLIHAFNPQAVLLGGGIMQEAYVTEKLEEIIQNNSKVSFRNCRILPASLGNKAALFGAASLAAAL
ncbi:MAG: ROK family protein [Ruthenibacterium sp.]